MRQLYILCKLTAFVSLMLWKEPFVKWMHNALFVAAPHNHFGDFFSVLANFLLYALGLNLLLTFLSGGYRRRQKMPKGRIDNVLTGMNNIYVLLMSGGVVAAILSLFGIDFQKLFTGLSIVAAAIAIITKDFIANIISGIFISFSKEFAIGDFVQIGEHKGKVMDITISKTALLTLGDDVVFVPNNFFFLHELINHSKMGRRTVNVEFAVDIKLLKTVESLEEDLIQSLEEFHENIEDGSFKLRIEEIEKDSIAFNFQYLLKHSDRTLEREIRRKTVRRVVNHIRG